MLDLMLADARTPTGGFAHSGGIEPARLALADVPAFVRGRLATVGLIDAAVAAAAAGGADPIELEAEWAARTPAEPLRRAAARQGQALLRLAGHLWPGALDSYAAASAATPRPVVLGLLGALGDLEPSAVARLCLYDDAATCCSAVPKLYAIDAAEVARWLADLAPLIARLTVVAAAAGATDAGAASLPAASAPLLDVRAVAHAADARRLFVT
jgi:urease accessory protein